jgi:thiol-disulfide isomerase/thioredoxin
MKGGLALLAFLVLSVGQPDRLSAQDDVGIALGHTPPPVTIEDLNGKPVDLARLLHGRPALLEFWATWCPICRALEPKLDQAHASYGQRVQFVAIAVAVNESPASVRRHLAQHPRPYRFLWDTNGNAVRAFEAPATSFMVVLDAKGKVVYTGVGEDQDLDAALARAVAVN